MSTVFQLSNSDFRNSVTSLEHFVNAALSEYVDHLYELAKKRNALYNIFVQEWYAQPKYKRVLKKFFVNDGIEPGDDGLRKSEKCMSDKVDTQKFNEIVEALNATRDIMYFGLLSGDPMICTYLKRIDNRNPWLSYKFPSADSLIFMWQGIRINTIDNYRMLYDISDRPRKWPPPQTDKDLLSAYDEHSKAQYYSFAWSIVHNFYPVFMRLLKQVKSEHIGSVESVFLDREDFSALTRLNEIKSEYPNLCGANNE